MELILDGSDRVLAAVKQLGDRALPAIGAALFQEAENIMAVSAADYVPVDQGDLRASAFVDAPVQAATSVSVALGYNAEYALYVHENPRSGKTGGVSPSGKRYPHWAATGQWKYLEDPWKFATLGMDERLAVRLEAAIVAPLRRVVP